jgi:hypothetical protein
MSADLEIGPYKVYVSEFKDRYEVNFSTSIFGLLEGKSITLPKEVKE